MAHPGVGCNNPWCCEAICDFDPWCCTVEWDEFCLRWTQDICSGAPGNSRCFSTTPWGGALPVGVGDDVLIATARAYEVAADPGFCCHSGNPGGKGYGTVWFKFVATDTSARISTCNSPLEGGDTLIEVFRVLDPSTPQTSCESLDVIGCSDDVPGCGTGVHSDVCVTDLVPGDTYYVLLGSKFDEDDDPEIHEQGLYRLEIESPCTPDVERPTNDLCHLASPIQVGITPFDVTSATFQCPGEPCLGTVLQNDIWYDWTAPCTGLAVVTTCDPDLPPEQQPNTSLAIYRGWDCPPAAGSRVDCSWISLGQCSFSPTIGFDTLAGDRYKIRLGGHLGLEPSGDLRITCDRACPAGTVDWLDPPDSVVDARQPHPIDDPANLRGIDTVIVAAPTGADATCWTLCETDDNPTLHPPYAPGLVCNAILGVQDNRDGTYTITLKRPIAPGEVTTITYTDELGVATTGTFISHPANVDADGAASAVDILAMIDILNGATPSAWGIHSTDIDHSELAAAADILAVIDLLNHGWLGTELPSNPGVCP